MPSYITDQNPQQVQQKIMIEFIGVSFQVHWNPTYDMLETQEIYMYTPQKEEHRI